MSAEDWFLNDYEYGDVEYGEQDEPLPTPAMFNGAKFTEPCLILHPKHRNVIGGVFLALGTKFPVVFSECCEEGKAYMITDLDTIERVRGNLE